MEKITENELTSKNSESMERSSQNIQHKPSSTQPKPPSQEKIKAAIAFLNQHRLLKGWGLLEGGDAELGALAWIDYFDQFGIPAEHYQTLYRRARDKRAQARLRGLKLDDLSAEDFVECWQGEYGLADELERERRRSGKILTDVAASGCVRCMGYAGERIFNNQTGQFLGRKPGTCEHKPLEPHEYLYRMVEEGKAV